MEPHPAGGRKHRDRGRRLKASGAGFRNDIVAGIGGKQVLVEDLARRKCDRIVRAAEKQQKQSTGYMHSLYDG